MRRTMPLLLVAGLAAAGAAPAAYFVEGATLARWIGAYDRVAAGRGGDADVHDAALLAGYIEGVVDAGDGTLFCLTRSLPVSDVLALARRQLEADPGQAQRPAMVVLANALQADYPCAAAQRQPVDTPPFARLDATAPGPGLAGKGFSWR